MRTLVEFKTYCLGGPISMEKCKTCHHARNWDLLNELPDEWRLPNQKKMERINEEACRITSGCHYKAKEWV